MKIQDVLYESDTPDEIMDELVAEFRMEKRTFKSASHKFYTVRKKLASEDEENADIINNVTPGEFFTFMKSNKPPVPKDPDPNSTPSEASTAPTPVEEFEDIQTIDMDRMKKMGYYPYLNWYIRSHIKHNSTDDIVTALYNSAIGSGEDYGYLVDTVNDVSNKWKNEQSKLEQDELLNMEVSSSDLQKFKNNEKLLNGAMNSMVTEFKKDKKKYQSASDKFKAAQESASKEMVRAMGLPYYDIKKKKAFRLVKEIIDTTTAKEFFEYMKK